MPAIKILDFYEAMEKGMVVAEDGPVSEEVPFETENIVRDSQMIRKFN